MVRSLGPAGFATFPEFDVSRQGSKSPEEETSIPMYYGMLIFRVIHIFVSKTHSHSSRVGFGRVRERGLRKREVETAEGGFSCTCQQAGTRSVCSNELSAQLMPELNRPLTPQEYDTSHENPKFFLMFPDFFTTFQKLSPKPTATRIKSLTHPN